MRRGSRGLVRAQARRFASEEPEPQPLNLGGVGLTTNGMAELQRQMAEEDEQNQQEQNQQPSDPGDARPERTPKTHPRHLLESLQGLRRTILSLPESVRANLVSDYPISEAEKKELRAACGLPPRDPPSS